VEVGGVLLGKALDLRLGVFNGAGLGKENDNRDVLVALRVEGRPLGPLSPGITDTDAAETPRAALGLGAAFDLPAHQSAYEEEIQYNSADASITADVHLKWQGLSLLGAIFYRYADHGGGVFKGEGDDLTEQAVLSLGGTIQAAYCHAKTRLTPAVRYSVYDASLDRSKNHVHQATAALTYTLVPGHAKLTLDYSGLFPSDASRSYLAPMDSWVEARHDLSIVAEIRF
jgi:hypothetical protein